MTETETHLRDYLRVVSKRKYTVVTFFLIVFVGIVVSVFSSTPMYMATTKLLIEKEAPPGYLSQNRYYAPQLYDPEFYTTQNQIIKSVSVTKNVVDILSLDRTYETYFSTNKKQTPSIFRTAQKLLLRFKGGRPAGRQPSPPPAKKPFGREPSRIEFPDKGKVARRLFGGKTLATLWALSSGEAGDLGITPQSQKGRIWVFEITAVEGCLPDEFLDSLSSNIVLLTANGSERPVIGVGPLSDKIELKYKSKACERKNGVVFFRGYFETDKSARPLGLILKGLGNNPPADSDRAYQSFIERKDKAFSIAKAISGGILVTPVKNSRIVNVSYRSQNPELAMTIVNTVAKAYIEKTLEMKMTSSINTIKWLSDKADQERVKIAKSQGALQKYVRQNDILTIENKIAIVPQRLSELGMQLIRANAKRRELESLSKMTSEINNRPDLADTIMSIANDRSVQSVRNRIFEAEQTLMNLSKKYGEKHPSMLRARANMEILQNKKKKEIARVIESRKNTYELAVSNVETLRRLLEATKREALNLNEKFLQYEVLKRGLETNKQLYDAIMRKIKEQDITKQLQTVNVWVLEKAVLPGAPFKPQKTRGVMAGLLFGLLSGLAMAFFAEYLDNTIKTPEDTEHKLGVPVLGMVSLVRKPESVERALRDNPSSVLAEEFKSLRTSILLSSAEKPPKNILITSIWPGEGKTATAINLALTVAQSERSVLLIDSDLRKPRIHKVFGIKNATGLSTILAGVTGEEAIKKLPGSSMRILPSGPIPPNPSELLGSKKMEKFLKEVCSRFDIVIWDSAPIMTVSDSMVLTRLLDSTILLAWAGRTTFEDMRRGLKALHDINSHVLGILINAFDVKKTGYYHYKYYSYYGSDEPPDKSQDKPSED